MFIRLPSSPERAGRGRWIRRAYLVRDPCGLDHERADQMSRDLPEHSENLRGLLLCQQIDLKVEMIAPFGCTVDCILPYQDEGRQ